MPVTDVQRDANALTMTLTAEFDAPVEHAWEMWSDPRKLERWWGPPTYPATVEEHDLAPGGRVAYFMTGPEGDRHHGYWNIVEADPPHRLVFQDGFANEDGTPNDALPGTTGEVTLAERDGGGTVMTIHSTFPSAEAMEEMVKMGMVEGITAAVNQIDELLVTA